MAVLWIGSDRGGQRAGAIYSLIVTAKMNDVDPQAWLAGVLARIAAHPAHRLDELLRWDWRARTSLSTRLAGGWDANRIPSPKTLATSRGKSAGALNCCHGGAASIEAQ